VAHQIPIPLLIKRLLCNRVKMGRQTRQKHRAPPWPMKHPSSKPTTTNPPLLRLPRLLLRIAYTTGFVTTSKIRSESSSNGNTIISSPTFPSILRRRYGYNDGSVPFMPTSPQYSDTMITMMTASPPHLPPLDTATMI